MAHAQPPLLQRISRAPFGTLPDGTNVDVFRLANANGITMAVITYGGIITSLCAPDKDGVSEDIVLGYDTLDPYLADSPYFGAIVGRYGNRIARGEFTLDGTVYKLAKNNGPNALHGGLRGFDKVVWHAEAFEREDRCGVVLSHTSLDGDEGYPGKLNVRVTYTLGDDNALRITYDATTDRATPVNLTQHTYFNLTSARRDVLGHELLLNADAYTPVDATLIPLGEQRAVDESPFDFREFTAIGARIRAEDAQIQLAGGYDHNFVLGSAKEDSPMSTGTDKIGAAGFAASVFDPESGRTLEIFTTEPGVQFYSGNFLDGTLRGKSNRVYERHYGFCLETQHFPDSPNQPLFPSTILRPGERYASETAYVFGVMG